MTQSAAGLLYLSLLLPLAGWGAFVAWKWLSLKQLGGQVYDANVADGLLKASVPREAYIRAYVRAERPVMGVCMGLAALAAFVLVPLVIRFFFNTIAALNNDEARAVTVQGQRFEGIAGDFLGFVVVLALNAALLLIAMLAAYRLRGPTLRSETRRLEELHE